MSAEDEKTAPLDQGQPETLKLFSPENMAEVFVRTMERWVLERMGGAFRRLERQGRPFPSDMEFYLLSLLPPELQDEFEARARLLGAVAKKYAVSYSELSSNNDAANFSKEQLRILLEKKGVLPALALYVAMFHDALNLPDFFGDATLPLNFYEIKDLKQLEEVRRAMVTWLRQQMGDQVDEAEAIAWNLLCLANVPEFHEGGGKKPPFMSPAVRTLMWPFRRLIEDARNGTRWGMFGRWAFNQIRANPNWRPPKDIFPEPLILTAFHEIPYKDDTNPEGTFYDFLLNTGRRIIEQGTDVGLRPVDWSRIREYPFKGYFGTTIKSAALIVLVFEKGFGGLDKTSPNALDNACGALRFTERHRKTVYNALSPSRPDPAP